MRIYFQKRSFALGVLAVLVLLVAFPVIALEGAPDEDYIIGPEDILIATVWDNADLSGNVPVGLDGYITFKFIGRLKASGLTLTELSNLIASELSKGYINKPQLTVQVATYRSKEIHIIGEVKMPGTYYLNKRTTIVEAVSMAKGPTNGADSEVIVVRQPTDGEGKSITVNLRRALEGDISQNIEIFEGDSIYLSKAKTFFIMGEVNKPGQYNLEKDTSIRKAISIAGGNTEKAALNRVKIIRTKDNEELRKEVELDEIIQPLDTIVVPQSYF